MSEAVIVSAAIVLAIIAALTLVVWLLRAPLLRLLAEAVYAEQRRDIEARRAQRPVEVFTSGSRTFEPERDVVLDERERREVERAAKLEAGRVVARERGWSS